MPAHALSWPTMVFVTAAASLLSGCGNSGRSDPPPPINQLPGLRFAALDAAAFDAPVRQIVDLDNDGDEDVVTQSSVLRNNGAGGFDSVAAGLGRPVVADFDGDGDLDRLQGEDELELVRTDATPGEPIVMRPADGSRRGRRVTANLDSDSNPDLLVLREQGGVQTLELYRGEPGTTPRLLQQHDWLIGLGVPTAIDFAIGDLDGDSDLDIAILDSTRSLMLALNGGGLKFAPVRNRIQTLASRVLIADVDGDATPDVITHDGREARLWLNRGRGAFDLVGSTPPCAELFGATDLTGDKLAELVVRRDGRTLVLQPDQNFLFQPADHLSTDGSSARGPVFRADLNGDGADDMVIGSTWLAAHATGYRNVVAPNALTAVRPEVAAHGDVDLDGLPDLVVVDGDQLHTLFGQLDGSYRQGRVNSRWQLQTNALELADLDADGRPELIVAATGQDRILSWNSFHWVDLGQRMPPAQDDSRAIAITDVDGDSWPDVITVTTEEAKVHRNLGKGSSGAQRLEQTIELESGSWPAIAFGDYDADGDPDALLPTTLLRNDGGRLVATGNPVASRSAPTSVALVDIDRDGDLDGLVLRAEAPVLLRNVNSVLLDDGPFLPDGVSLRGAARPVDLDADGDLDLLDDGQVLENTGIATLEFIARADRLPDGANILRAFDADGDRDMDLLDANLGMLRNLTVQLAIPRPALVGSTLAITAHSRLAGAMRSTLVIGNEVRPVPLPFGTLYAGGALFTTLGTLGIPTKTGQVTHSIAVPNDARLRGAELVLQSLIEATVQLTDRRLTNAVTVRLN